MPISQVFTWIFASPKQKTHCQTSHSQRQQNQKLSQQLQSLNPQSILKQHGKLDQRYQKVIQQANIQSAYRVQKYMQKYRGLLQNVDNYCNQNKSHKYGDKLQCVEQMDGILLDKFQKPFIKSQLNLYKVANLCLIKGDAMSKCIEEVKRQNIDSLQKGLTSLQELVRINCK